MRQNGYVITGGMGFGKTTLIEELCRDGRHHKIPEVAKDIIDEQIKTGGRLIPWVDRYGFENALLDRRIQLYLSAPEDRICFFDRGIPEAIPFFRSEGKEIPRKFFQASEEYRYNKKVFVVPPWREIYVNRPARPQAFDEAVVLGELIAEAYRELGYELVEVPRVSPAERARFVLRNVGVD